MGSSPLISPAFSPNRGTSAGQPAGPSFRGRANTQSGAEDTRSLLTQYAQSTGKSPSKAEAGESREDALKALRAERYADIMAHEQAHATAAGPYGGGIVIDYDSNGVAVGGHVPIHIPGLDPHNAETSRQAYKTIYNAALAPHDPSSQDMAVAAQAQSLMGQAQVLIDQKRQKNPQNPTGVQGLKTPVS